MRPGGGFGGPMNGGKFDLIYATPEKILKQSNFSGMMRGRGRGGPPRGPPRMGMNPGMNRGAGRGRFPSGPGRFPSESNGYFQNQNQNENSAPAPVQQTENVPAEKPITPVTQSSNNVQVVTSGPTQPAPTQQPPQTTPTSNPPMNNSRGSFTPRGRSSFGSRGGFVSRGRGGYQGQNGPPRQQFDTRQPSNLTPASTNAGYNPIKRGGFQGPPGAKRGRYDQGPGGYTGNRMPPQNQISSMPPQQHHQNSYNNVPP